MDTSLRTAAPLVGPVCLSAHFPIEDKDFRRGGSGNVTLRLFVKTDKAGIVL